MPTVRLLDRMALVVGEARPTSHHEFFINGYFTFGHSGYFVGPDGPGDFMSTWWVPLLASDAPAQTIDSRLPSTVIGGVGEFVIENAEPIKLVVYILPLLAIILYLLRLNETIRTDRGAATARQLAAQSTLVEAGGADSFELSSLLALQAMQSQSFQRLPAAIRYAIGTSGRQTVVAEAETALRTAMQMPVHQRLGIVNGDDVRNVAFSPDGQTISVSGLRFQRVVDLVSGRDVAHYEHNRLLFVADGAYAAAGEKALTVVDSRSGIERWIVSGPFLGSSFGGLVATLKGGLLAAASDYFNGRVRVFDIDSGRDRFAVEHLRAAVPLAFSPDGGLLAIAYDTTVRVVDTTSGKERIQALFGMAGGAAFTPDGTHVCFYDSSQVLILDTTGHGSVGRRVSGLDRVSVAIDGNGWPRVALVKGLTVDFIDASTGGKVRTKDVDLGISSFALSNDGQAAFASGWVVRTDNAVLNFNESKIAAMNFSPQGDLLAAATESGVVRLVNTATGIELPSLRLGQPISRLVLDANGRRLAMVSGRTVRVF